MSRKNIGSFLAFNEGWFRKHQRALLWLLNCPVVSLWSRWVLRIRRCDCDWRERIAAIGPNRFVVALGGGQYRADFRTHWKYSKRLYFAFRPLWWALHGWDAFVQACWLPQLGFGFDTLTVYPDPHEETTSVDGQAYRYDVDESFAAIRAGAGTGASDDSSAAYPVALQASNIEDQFTWLSRGFFLFDTSALGANAEISGAILSLLGGTKFDELGADSIEIVAAAPSSNTQIVAADYSQTGSTSFADKPYAEWVDSAYNHFPLNALGIVNISKTDISKFGTRGGWDRAGVFGGIWIAGGKSAVQCICADTPGTATDPKLVVTYIPPPPGRLTSITIGGNEYIQAARLAETESVKDLGGRMATCSLGLDTDKWPAEPPLQGEVIVWGGDPPTRHFAGYVSRMEPTQAEHIVRVTCQDYTRLLDTVVVESELFYSQTDKTILTYLLANYLPEISSADIEETATIPSLELTDVTLREAVERIAERTGAEWYVDFDKKLQYYDAANNPAPFGLSESPDDVDTFSFLREEFTYSEDFSNPANQVTVVGLISEQGWKAPEYRPPTSLDDGSTWRVHAAWPPDAGGGLVDTESAVGWVTNTFGGGNYTLANMLVRFDTSIIPNDATVVFATLGIYPSDIVNADSGELGVEYYAAWPIDAADYSSTPSNNASGYWPLSILGADTWNWLPLRNLGNITKTGFSGFRFHLKLTGAPSGENNLTAMLTPATGQSMPPRLLVAWKITATHDDAASQAEFGRTFSRTIIDHRITTTAEALVRAEIEAERYAWPQKSGVVKIHKDGLDIGQLLTINAPSVGVNGDFVIRRVGMRWLTGDTIEYTLEFGDYRPDLITLLRKMAANQ